MKKIFYFASNSALDIFPVIREICFYSINLEKEENISLITRIGLPYALTPLIRYKINSLHSHEKKGISSSFLASLSLAQ